MNNSGSKKIFSLGQTILIVIIAITIASIITYNVATLSQDQSALSPAELYQAAITDAMVAEPDEIMPLAAINKDSAMLQWNETKDKVLLATWHRYPDSYPDKATVENSWGEIWVFLPQEMKNQFRGQSAEDEILRLEQLLGLPPQNGYTNFTTIWVAPKDIFRPSYDNEISDNTVQLQFEEKTDPDYVEWFEQNIVDSYFPPEYPWTRLGYTYDWSGDGTEYGLSEFIVKEGSRIVVDKTYTNEEFLAYLND